MKCKPVCRGAIRSREASSPLRADRGSWRHCRVKVPTFIREPGCYSRRLARRGALSALGTAEKSAAVRSRRRHVANLWGQGTSGQSPESWRAPSTIRWLLGPQPSEPRLLQASVSGGIQVLDAYQLLPTPQAPAAPSGDPAELQRRCRARQDRRGGGS